MTESEISRLRRRWSNESMMVQNAMPEDFRILPSPALKEAAQACPLLEGDRAKGEWVACCTQRFLPVAKHIAGDDELAMEALQITWIKILEAVNFSLEGPVACPWVSVIVANTAKDLLRARVRRRVREVPFDHPPVAREAALGPEAAILERQSLELMLEIIAMLPDTYRKVVELRAKGLSAKETGQRLGISSSNVDTRLHRAKKKVEAIIAARIKEGKAVP